MNPKFAWPIIGAALTVLSASFAIDQTGNSGVLNVIETAGTPSIGETPNSRLIANELSRCPAWTNFAPTEVEFRSGITGLYFDLAKYPTADIREGIKEYLARTSCTVSQYEKTAKVFAFLRIVFEIPPSGVRNDQAWIVGRLGNPVRDGVIDLLWPFTLDANGQLRLTGVGLTQYSQIPNMLAAFDALAAKFPRRIVADSTPAGTLSSGYDATKLKYNAAPADSSSGYAPRHQAMMTEALKRLPLSGLTSGWKEYSYYLKYVIACVQRTWDQILDQDRIEVAPGTCVTVTFVLSSRGEVARVVSHTPGADSPAVQACMTAIVTSGPYGPWTKEMAAVLGNEQKMTFAFAYQ